MVKLIQGEPGETEEGYGTALSQRLEKVQFKTLKPLIWKSLTEEPFLSHLAQMGLSSFFRSRFVQGDEFLCREFLCSYKKHGSGYVREEAVHTTPKIVQAVLKLPHTGKAVKDVPKLTAEELCSIYNGPTVKVKHNGFSVKALSDPHFKEFVSFMVDRMSCKVNCTYVSAEILYAAKYVWDTKVVLDWAGYMSHRIQAQCEKVRGTSQSAFEYTQYLTQIIQYQLGLAGEDQGAGAGAGAESPADDVSEVQRPGDAVGLQLVCVGAEKVGAASNSQQQHPGVNVNGGEKRARRQHEARAGGSKKQRSSSRDGPDYALNLLEKVSDWVRCHGREQQKRGGSTEPELSSAEKRVNQLELELEEVKVAEQQKQRQWELQLNLIQQEKMVLQDQVQALIAQQAALRQRLDVSERERIQLQSYLSRTMNGKKDDAHYQPK